MKKIYTGILSLLIMLTLLPIAFTSEGVVAQETAIAVPSDWENDLWLNSDFEQMQVGDTYTIFSRRIPELVDDFIYNTGLVVPNMNYRVISGDSVIVEKVANDPDQKAVVTAKKEGISIIEVTYDETTMEGAFETFGASSSVNTAYMVVEVNNQLADVVITSNTLDTLTTYDTIYYTNSETTSFTFDANVTKGEVTSVTCNGETLIGNQSTYTAQLENRANIIGISATYDNKSITKYYIVDARYITINVSNVSRPNAPIQEGDEVAISFTGISVPIPKLAGIYNPCYTDKWGGTSKASAVQYKMNNELYYGRSGQWDLATNNTISLTFDEAGSYTFDEGTIEMNWWGEAADAHKAKFNNAYAGGGSMSDQHQAFYSQLPSFTIDVAAYQEHELTSISLNKKELSIEEKTSDESLVASFAPIETTQRDVIWESSNPSIATVDQNGKIQALQTGYVTITVKSAIAHNDASASCKVQVFAELPATVEEKAGLLEKIEEAKLVIHNEAESAQASWLTLQEVLKKAEKMYADEETLYMDSYTMTKNLNAAIFNYNDAVSFIYTMTQMQIDEQTKVTITFPNLKIPENSGINPTWKWEIKTDLEGYESIEIDTAYEDANQFIFTIAEPMDTVFAIESAVLVQSYRSHPQFPYFTTVSHFDDKIRNITVTLGNVELIQSIHVAQNSIQLVNNEIKKVNYTINPATATKPVINFTSSDPNIAKVDNEGNVVGVGDGRVNIILTSKYEGESAIVVVDVENIDVRIQNIMNKINALGEVTFASEAQLKEISALYDTLPQERKAEVTNYEVAKEAENTIAEMHAIQDDIAQLDILSLDTQAEIKDVIARFEALSYEQRAKISNAKKLLDLQDALIANEDNLRQAQDVVNQIIALPNITLDSEYALHQVVYNYEKLSEEAKAYVTNLNTLQQAQAAYKKLYDQHRAQFVVDKIYAIGAVNASKAQLINDALLAYEVLSIEQRAYVTNYHVLLLSKQLLDSLLHTVEPESPQVILPTDEAQTEKEEQEETISHTQFTESFSAIDLHNLDAGAIEELTTLLIEIQQLSDEEYEALSKLIDLDAFKEAVAKYNQTNTEVGVGVSNVEWYVKLQAKVVELTKAQLDEIAHMMEDATLLYVVDLSLDNILINKKHNFDEPVQIEMDASNLENVESYQTIVAIHFGEEGIEYIPCTVDGGKVILEASSFSAYAFIGTTKSWNEFIDQADPQPSNTVYLYMIAIIAVGGLIIGSIMLKGKKDE